MYRRFKICCGFVLLSLAAGLAASCAPDSGPVDSGTRTGSIVAQVVWPEAVGTLATFSPNGVTPLDTPPGIFTVRALVTGPGMADPQQDFPTMPGDSGPAASGTITDIPAGSNRTLTLEGLNGLGVATYRGQVSGITVDPGQITDAGTITLSSFNVTSFTAIAGNGQVSLTWVNPTFANFTGVLIRRSTTTFPASPTDGTQVFDAAGTSFTDTSLTNGTEYFYTAFAHDGVANYAGGEQASAIPSTASLWGSAIWDSSTW